MKKILIKCVATATMILLAASCGKGDGDAEYGNSFVYIPQATQSGGLNNHYLVPSGEGPYTYNFKIEEGNVKIMMGVMRSGKTVGKAYSVDIVDDGDATERFVSKKDVEEPGKYLKMPMCYSFPHKIEVGNGESAKTFYVEIPVSEIIKNEYDSKILVLTLKLAESTVYPLSDKNTEVVVLLNINSMKAHF